MVCGAWAQGGKARVRVLLPADANVSLDYTGLLSWVDLGYGRQTASLNVDGQWEMDVELDKPGYYLLERNPIYLSPGDDLLIEPSQFPDKSVISGRGSEINNYLKDRTFVKGGSYLKSGVNVKPRLEDMIAVIDSMSAARRELLANLDAPEDFKRMETARIDGDYINSLFFYPIYNLPMYGDNVQAIPRDEYRAIQDAYFERIRPIVQPILTRLEGDDSLLDVEVVRYVLHQYSRVPNYEVHFSDYFEQLLEVGETASNISGSMSPEKAVELAAYGSQIENEAMRRVYMEKLERSTKYTGGQPAVDVAVEDLDGVQNMLSDYKGMVMYVDVWATWCAPCIMQAPFFKELSEQYPDVRFVALSVDDDKEAWEKHVRSKDNGRIIELLAEPEMRRKWDITGIPRFLLIDKDFNIITTEAPRPNNKEAIMRLLDSWVK